MEFKTAQSLQKQIAVLFSILSTLASGRTCLFQKPFLYRSGFFLGFNPKQQTLLKTIATAIKAIKNIIWYNV